MKKKCHFRRIVIICVLLLLSIGASYGGVRYFVNKAKVDNQNVNPQILKEMFDMNIKPCNDTPKRTKEQVIGIATNNGRPSKGVKLHAQYCLVTFGEQAVQQDDKAAEKDLASEGKYVYEGRHLWIVSFRFKGYRYGKQRQIEAVKVIDDASGVLVCDGSHSE